MRHHATRGALLALALSATGLMTGCGGDSDDARPAASWARASTPVDADGPVWARDGVVHLADGSTISTDPAMRRYVVAGDGVFFLTGHGTTTLEHATAAGIRSTGVTISGWDELRASPDGRYLAYIDRTSGTADRYDTRLAVAIVVDTTTGREVVHSSHGMGDPRDDDLADLYEDATSPQIVGVSGSVAWVAGPDGVDTYALPSGKRTGTYDGETKWDRGRPWVFQYGNTAGSAWNPARTWAFDLGGRPAPLLHPATGEDIAPRIDAAYWTLDRWIDDHTVLGYAFDRTYRSPSAAPRRQGRLMTCRVPSGACHRIEGATGGVLLPRPWLG